MDTFNGRHAVLVGLALIPLAVLLFLGPIPQDAAYHVFADTRRLFGIPNFFDVASNVSFFLVGAAGFGFCLRRECGPVRSAWLVLFLGVGLVSFGSAYYHWSPNDAALVWDRLPMTVGFMGLLAALLGEHVGARTGVALLGPLMVLGIGSVLYWYAFDDLRLYLWVQFAPLLLLPCIVALFRGRYTHRGYLFAALGWYALAKVAEGYDAAVFRATGGVLSGHTVKHLLAAAGCYSLLLMLRRRRLKR
jgi:hypothetical protein